jgi:DNA invertase Pin-like site-specific DNA recombinase
MRAAVYARVSTVDQEPENQLQEVRRYVQARDWTAAEYVDRRVSGAKDRRPALDDLVRDARRRRSRGHRRHDARRQAADAHSRRHRRV